MRLFINFDLQNSTFHCKYFYSFTNVTNHIIYQLEYSTVVMQISVRLKKLHSILKNPRLNYSSNCSHKMFIFEFINVIMEHRSIRETFVIKNREKLF